MIVEAMTQLKAARDSRGWNQRYVAWKTGITRCNYNRIENGLQKPRERNIQRFCELYQMTREELGLPAPVHHKERK